MQGDPGLHRVGEDGEQREQPERAGAQRLGAGEVRLRRGRLGARARRGRGRWRAGDDGGRAVVGAQADILGRADDQQHAGQEADGEHGEADRDPAGAPGAEQHDGALGDQRQGDQADHLRGGGDRVGGGAAGNEPVVHRAVDAKVERAGEVHPDDAIEQVEHRQRLGQRQRGAGERGGEHGGGQDHPRAGAVQQAAEAGRGKRREQPAERGGAGDRRARPAEVRWSSGRRRWRGRRRRRRRARSPRSRWRRG